MNKIIYIISFIFIVIVIYIITNISNTHKFKHILKHKKNLIPDKKKILIVTMENRTLDFLYIHNESVQSYCDLHGYTYIFQTEYINKLDLPIYWKKIQLVRDHLPYYDYVMWLDSDTIICNNSIPLENVIDLNKSIFIGKDFNRFFGIFMPYCAGVFIIKNNYIGKKFLDECIDTYINNSECKVDNTYTLNGRWAGECYEQGVMNKLLKLSYYKKHLYELPLYVVINSKFISTDTIILHKFGDKNSVYNIFNDIKSGKEFSLYYLE